MKLVNFRIGTRLAGGFALTLAMMVGVAGFGLAGLDAADHHMDDIVHDNVVKTNLTNDMSEQVHIVSRVLRTIVLLHEPARLEAEAGKITESRLKYERAWSEINKMPATEVGRALLDKIDAARSAARSVNDRVLELARANKDDEAIELLLSQAAPKVAAWQAHLDQYIELQRKDTEQAYAAAHASDVQAEVVLIVITLLAVILSAFSAWRITRSITTPLTRAKAFAEHVADGDLTVELKADGRDETANLIGALLNMRTSLATTVGGVRGNADGVATASAEIAAGNNDLSSRTEQQASALEQTAASMEQLGSTVRQNADNAKQANQLALGASAVAVKGGEVVGQVVDTMKGINDSSKKIADIISVIDSIAFQTNILALNAAVEAARAGEQGRGFAVVATEVRSLAQRSADAAKEIKSLITVSVERVEQGTSLVDQAGSTMQEIVTSIKRVTDIMGEISSASTEQSAGVAQVGEAVSQMDRATQQNAALVEQSAAAAESLKGQATQLVQAVAVFRLGAGEAQRAPALAAASGSATAAAKPAARSASSFSAAKPSGSAIPAHTAKTASTASKASAPAHTASPTAAGTPIERRGPNRAKNVTRPAFGGVPAGAGNAPRQAPAPVAAATGTDDWETF